MLPELHYRLTLCTHHESDPIPISNNMKVATLCKKDTRTRMNKTVILTKFDAQLKHKTTIMADHAKFTKHEYLGGMFNSDCGQAIHYVVHRLPAT